MQTQVQPFPRSGWIAFILFSASYLRITNLATSPGWFSDEGTHLDIAHHLLAGKTQYLAVTDSVLLFGRLPLFGQLLANALRLFPHGMLTLRGLTVALSLASIGLLMLPQLGLSDEQATNRLPPLALIPALLLALFYDPVVYARFGFSYNLLAPLLVLIYWLLSRYRQTQAARFLYLAGTAGGLALISDLWAVPLAPIIVYVGLRKRRRDLPVTIALLVMPGMIYLAHALTTAPDAFWFDLNYTLTRVSGVGLGQQLDTLADNVQMLLRLHSWLLLGGVGLLTLPPAQRNLAAALFWLPLLMIGRTVALHNLSFYYNIPLFPLACLGLVAAFQFVRRQLMVRTDGAAKRGLLTALTLFSIVWAGRHALVTLRAAQNGYVTTVDPFLVDAAAAQGAAAVVNERINSAELTLASPAVAWLIEGNSADFQHAAASVGLTPPHFPPNLPANRFAFNPHHSQAAYIITDPLWHSWAAVHVPGVADLLDELATWPTLYQQSGVVVYCRPTICQ